MRSLRKTIDILLNGGVGVLPTDTIYGIVGTALDPKVVERIYRLRKRNPKKPMIVLVGDERHLELFDIAPDRKIKKFLKEYWPGKISVVLPCDSPRFAYLHRDTHSLAIRFPKPAWLRNVLKKTGPLVAPSANFEGEAPSLTIKDAKKYFGKGVDFYIDHGRLESAPSTLVTFEAGAMQVLREGAVKIKK